MASPDGNERAGVRVNVHPLMEKNGPLTGLDTSAHFPAPSLGSWLPRFRTERRENNVQARYA